MDIAKSSTIPTRITLSQWYELGKKLSKNQQMDNLKNPVNIDILVASLKSKDSSVFNFIDFLSTDKSDGKLREHILSMLSIDSGPEVMDWLSETDFIITCNETILASASAYGNLEILKWYYTQFKTDFRININEIVYFAISNGHINIIKWIKNNICRPVYDPRAVDQAAGRGYLEVLKYLDDKIGIQYTACAIYNAAYNKHIHILDWFYGREQSFKFPPLSAQLAFANDNFGVIEWYIKRKLEFEYNHSDISMLIYYSKFDILKKITKMNPKLDQFQIVFEDALRESDHKVLDWFKNNKQCCKCDEKLVFEAYEHKNKNFIENIINYKFND